MISDVQLTCLLSGEWLISLSYGSEHINGSPFSCAVFDITKVRLEGNEQAVAGVESVFTCDTREAGPGLLEAEMETLNGDILPVKVDNKDGLYYLSVLPHTPGRYRIKVAFNKANVKGSPIILTVHHPSEYNMNGKPHPISNKPMPNPRYLVHDLNNRHKNESGIMKSKPPIFENVSHVKVCPGFV